MGLRNLFPVVLLVAVTSFQTASYVNGQTPDLNSLSDTDLKAVTIRLERAACYGTCPVYTLTIHGDGPIEYDGKAHVKIKGMQKGHVEPSIVKGLMSEFERVKFLSLARDYSLEKCTCRRCTDMASAATELTVGGVTHRVDHAYGCACAPKVLFELESAIDKAAHVEEWTGDVSKQGPFGTTCSG